MNSSFGQRILRLAFCTMLEACAWAAEPGVPEQPVLRLALVNSYGQRFMEDYYARTIAVLRREIAPVVLEVSLYDPDGFLKAAREQRFDIAIASSGLTSLMIEYTGGIPLTALSSNEAPDPNHANGGTIIVRADRADLQAIPDLRKSTLLIMSRNAFAGWQIPAAELLSQHIDPEHFFGSIRTVEAPMTNIVHMIRKGEADVGFVASCLLEHMAASGEIRLSDFRVLNEKKNDALACRHSTALYPNWFFSVKPSVPAPLAKALTRALLAMPQGANGTQWTIPTDHRRLYEVFKTLDLPYGEPKDLRWYLQKIRPYLVGALVLVLLGLLNTFMLVRLVRRRARELEATMQEKMRAELAVKQHAMQVENLTRASVVGLLSSMVAHELKQPMTVVTNYAGSLRRRLQRGDVPKALLLNSLAKIEASGLRASEVIDRVRAQGKGPSRVFARLDFSKLAAEAIEHWRQHSARVVPCRVRLEPGLIVQADRMEMELVVLNLLKNASVAAGRKPDPELEVELRRENGYARLQVLDNGPAVSDDVLEHMRDIGFSTNPDGLGLGIAIANLLLEAHGGSLSFSQRDDLMGDGLCCTVRLPLEIEEGAPAASDDAEP